MTFWRTFFGCVRGSNCGPWIYYALSLPTELSSWGHILENLSVYDSIFSL